MFVIVHGRCHLIKIMTNYDFFFSLFLKIMLCASMMFEPHTVSAVRAIKVTLEVVVCVYTIVLNVNHYHTKYLHSTLC